MFDRPDGEWEIITFADSIEDDEYVDPVDRWSVQEFLRHFKPDRATMSDLRRLLYQFGPVSRYTNDDVIDGIVARLVAGDLLFRRRRREWEFSAAGGSSTGERQSSSSESSGSSLSSPKGPEPEPDTFSDNDGAAQAAALAAAAASGVPFCEECQRAQQANN